MLPLSYLRSLIYLFLFSPVVLFAQIPDTVVLCSNGSAINSTSLTGVAYDSGGPFGSYNDNQYCSLLIAPEGCVGEISVTLDYFSSEGCCDYLFVYDVSDAGNTLLGNFAGLAGPTSMQAPSGKVLIIWASDGSVIDQGFQLSWTGSILPEEAPVTTISFSTTNPAHNEPVSMNASSTGGTHTWEWDFGNGTTGSGPDQVHYYSVPGTYSVQLITTNCYDLKDTVITVLTVQEPPMISVMPDTIFLSAPCGTVASTTFDILNSGTGDLLYNLYLPDFNFTVDSTAGLVHPDTFVTVQLNIPLDGYYVGNYAGTLQITQNQFSDYYTVPVILDVTGQPAFAPEPASLDFGTVAEFSTNSAYVYLQNPGCAPLEITSITSDNPDFTLSETSFTIPEFSVVYLLVTGMPTDTGFISGQLQFETNAGSFSYPLKLYAYGVPQISIYPDTIDISLACQDSISVAITVANTGLAPLELFPSGSNPFVITRVLIADVMSYNSGVGYNIANWILAQDPYANISYLPYGLSDADFNTMFQQADIVVFPALGGTGSYTETLIQHAVQELEQRGGTLIVTGTPYANLVESLGLFDISGAVNNYYSYYPFIPLDPTNFLVENIDFQSEIYYDEIWSQQVLSPGYMPVLQVNGDDIAGYRSAGSGEVIYIGYECEYNYNQAVRMVQNAYLRAVTTWLNVITPSAVIAPGDSAVVTVKINSTGLQEGDYQRQFLLQSNDPLHPGIFGTVLLHVEGDPQISSAISSLNFGILQAYSTQIRDLEIENTGCDTLFFTDFVFSNPAFSAVGFPASILPYSSATGQVLFQPVTSGSYASTLTIQSDGGEQVISLSGLAVAAPQVVVTPASIESELDCSSSEAFSLIMENTGEGGYGYTSGPYTGPVRVVVLGYGAVSYRLNNIVSTISNIVPNLQLSIVYDGVAAAFSDSLAKADILLIPSLEYNDPAVYGSFYTPVQAFLNRGGQVFLAGVYYNEPLVQMGLISNNAYFNAYSGPALKVLVPSHPLTKNMPASISTLGYQYDASFGTNSGFSDLVDIQGSSSWLSYKSAGNGFVVWCGFAFESEEDFMQPLVQNYFKWAYQPLPPGTISDLPEIGSLAAAQSTTLQVSITAAGVPGGIYPGQIRLYGNDPVHNPLIIPIVLETSFQPCADFETNLTCNGQALFVDKTLNGLTSWYWNFGDGFEAFTQNPQHNFQQSGDYTVVLVGCNDFGCDTISTTIQVEPISALLPPVCKPEAIAPCCNAGIYNVAIGNLDYSSGSAAEEGYVDLACSAGTVLAAGNQYEMKVTTGDQYSEYVMAWIDFNNDGVFNNNERIVNDNAFQIHEAFVTVPFAAVRDIPLRMRVISDAGMPTSACGDPSSGQAEDYYVLIPAVVSTAAVTQLLPAAISPNPAAGNARLSFTANEGEAVQWSLSNASGQEILSKVVQSTGTQQFVELPWQPSGVYWVRLQTGTQVFTGKWICVEP